MVDETTTAAQTDADKLAAAIKAAGWTHPDAPPGFPTPGHALAAAETPAEVDHLVEIADLAAQAKTATPSGVDAIADQITAHVAALQEGK